jgi:NAD(P)-dependent dehydrogenase (short-subunit alcohol dehydrogenase family)
MLVRVAADEWGADGLRVNAVAPGVTRTPMLGAESDVSVESSPWLASVAERTTLGRLGEPEDIAQVILAVHGMEWVTGQIVECDGGLSLRSPIDPYGEALRARTSRAR